MTDIVKTLQGYIRRDKQSLASTAKTAGVSEDTLKNLVEGKSVPSTDTVQKLVDHFGLSLASKGNPTWTSLTIVTVSIASLAAIGTVSATYIRKIDSERGQVEQRSRALAQFRSSIVRLGELTEPLPLDESTDADMLYPEPTNSYVLEASLVFNSARSLEPELKNVLTYADYQALAYHAKAFLGTGQSADYFSRSLECAENSKDDLAVSTVLGNFASLYYSSGDTVNARKHMERAISTIKNVIDLKRNHEFVANLYAQYAVHEYEYGLDQNGETALQEGLNMMSGNLHRNAWKKAQEGAIAKAKKRRARRKSDDVTAETTKASPEPKP